MTILDVCKVNANETVQLAQIENTFNLCEIHLIQEEEKIKMFWSLFCILQDLNLTILIIFDYNHFIDSNKHFFRNFLKSFDAIFIFIIRRRKER